MSQSRSTLSFIAITAVAILSAPAFAKGIPPGAGRQPPPVPAPNPQPNQPPPPDGPRPRVEVVFVIDTTGSMGGLIQGAKDKVWSIANHIVSGNPRPDIKVGLVAYRDLGDEYVTRDYPLTGDLDAVYGNLRGFVAAGGGDTPEHVNKGLNDAVNGMQWSAGAMKMVFLVGDAPPHMDYKDGFDYHQIVKDAHKKEIAIYTIRCGGDPNTERVWKEIASAGHGVYASIAQNGGVAVIPTPMDGELAILGKKLDDTTVVYGGARDRERVEAKKTEAAAAPAAAAADRGGYYAKSGARMDDADLVAGVASGEVDVTKLDAAKLPDAMKGMSAEERKAYVAKKQAERAEVLKQMSAVSARRDAYLKTEAAKGGAKTDGFDAVVDKAISAQGAEYKIAY